MRGETHRAVGNLLRTWRTKRKLSQLELASKADVSTRHLSFLENGRSNASPEMLLHLAHHLDIPLRERNDLLLAAGHAPKFMVTTYDSVEMRSIRAVIDVILRGHEPFPAIVIDRSWNVIGSNHGARIFTGNVDPTSLGLPLNVVRMTLHPAGLAPMLTNLSAVADQLIMRLRRQIEMTGDPELEQLLEDIREYPAVAKALQADTPLRSSSTDDLVLPMQMLIGGRRLSFMNTIATFGAPLDVVTSELAIEAYHPADDQTAAYLRSLADPDAVLGS